MYSKVERCRICGNNELVEILSLGHQTLTGIFPESRTQALTSGPLTLVKCVGGETVCGLVQLLHSYDLGEMYGRNYGYRSGLNMSMVQHLRGKVRKILDFQTPPKGSLVLDIGSNDSTTLQAYPEQQYVLAGIDPTGEKFKNYYPGHIQLIPHFFSAEKVEEHFGAQKAAIVTSFSMFYDLEDPVAFMQEVADVLAEGGIWVFEQSYLPTMLDRISYDTVCHEHLEYYCLKQIAWMADKAGLKILDVELNEINGGSFSVVATKKTSPRVASASVAAMLASESNRKLDDLTSYVAFARSTERSREALLEFLHSAMRSGKSVSGLGASTKGNVILQYCGINQDLVQKVGEVNADKYGCFTPGTLLPIVPQDELLAEHPDFLLVLPWHFRDFFQANMSLAGRKLVYPLPTLEIVTV